MSQEILSGSSCTPGSVGVSGKSGEECDYKWIAQGIFFRVIRLVVMVITQIYAYVKIPRAEQSPKPVFLCVNLKK